MEGAGPRSNTYANVHVNLTDFGAFFQRLLRALGGDRQTEQRLGEEYAAALRAAPDPKRGLAR